MLIIKDVLAREAARDTTDLCSRVYLYRDGSPRGGQVFVRAYNWSAWLLSLMTPNPMRVVTMSNDEAGAVVAAMGFPDKTVSWEKYVPPTLQRIADTPECITHALPPQLLPAGGDPARMAEAYRAWFDALPPPRASAAKGRKADDEARASPPEEATPEGDAARPRRAAGGHLSMLDIVREIVDFDLDEASPEACRRFIRHVQKMARRTIFG